MKFLYDFLIFTFPTLSSQCDFQLNSLTLVDTYYDHLAMQDNI